MKIIMTTTALVSALALGALVDSIAAKAQDAEPRMQECMGENCPQGGGMQGGEEQGVPSKRMRKPQPNAQTGDQGGDAMPRKKRFRAQQSDDNDDVNVDVDVRSRTRVGEGRWRFDPNRHNRRRSKDTTFRFYYEGYWYPQPDWEVYSVRPRYRISCGEGRGIVSERFNRVRVVECNGGTYTYLGRRQGDTYRVLLNARTGRIVGRTLI
jgi:hypothetical protein